ncbi:MAG: hypothetical protein PHD32_10920 [Eubacteriales bacterium]|nr:hypothetical protein [Eubacteriales bacterium]
MLYDFLRGNAIACHGIGTPLGHTYAVPEALSAYGQHAVGKGKFIQQGGAKLQRPQRNAKIGCVDVLIVYPYGLRPTGGTVLRDFHVLNFIHGEPCGIQRPDQFIAGERGRPL